MELQPPNTENHERNEQQNKKVVDVRTSSHDSSSRYQVALNLINLIGENGGIPSNDKKISCSTLSTTNPKETQKHEKYNFNGSVLHPENGKIPISKQNPQKLSSTENNVSVPIVKTQNNSIRNSVASSEISYAISAMNRKKQEALIQNAVKRAPNSNAGKSLSVSLDSSKKLLTQTKLPGASSLELTGPSPLAVVTTRQIPTQTVPISNVNCPNQPSSISILNNTRAPPTTSLSVSANGNNNANKSSSVHLVSEQKHPSVLAPENDLPIKLSSIPIVRARKVSTQAPVLGSMPPRKLSTNAIVSVQTAIAQGSSSSESSEQPSSTPGVNIQISSSKISGVATTEKNLLNKSSTPPVMKPQNPPNQVSNRETSSIAGVAVQKLPTPDPIKHHLRQLQRHKTLQTKSQEISSIPVANAQKLPAPDPSIQVHGSTSSNKTSHAKPPNQVSNKNTSSIPVANAQKLSAPDPSIEIKGNTSSNKTSSASVTKTQNPPNQVSNKNTSSIPVASVQKLPAPDPSIEIKGNTSSNKTSSASVTKTQNPPNQVSNKNTSSIPVANAQKYPAPDPSVQVQGSTSSNKTSSASVTKTQNPPNQVSNKNTSSIPVASVQKLPAPDPNIQVQGSTSSNKTSSASATSVPNVQTMKNNPSKESSFQHSGFSAKRTHQAFPVPVIDVQETSTHNPRLPSSRIDSYSSHPHAYYHHNTYQPPPSYANQYYYSDHLVQNHHHRDVNPYGPYPATYQHQCNTYSPPPAFPNSSKSHRSHTNDNRNPHIQNSYPGNNTSHPPRHGQLEAPAIKENRNNSQAKIDISPIKQSNRIFSESGSPAKGSGDSHNSISEKSDKIHSVIPDNISKTKTIPSSNSNLTTQESQKKSFDVPESSSKTIALSSSQPAKVSGGSHNSTTQKDGKISSSFPKLNIEKDFQEANIELSGNNKKVQVSNLSDGTVGQEKSLNSTEANTNHSESTTTTIEQHAQPLSNPVTVCAHELSSLSSTVSSSMPVLFTYLLDDDGSSEADALRATADFEKLCKNTRRRTSASPKSRARPIGINTPLIAFKGPCEEFPGFTLEVVKRRHCPKRRTDNYWYPEGWPQKLRSRVAVLRYIEAMKLTNGNKELSYMHAHKGTPLKISDNQKAHMEDQVKKKTLDIRRKQPNHSKKNTKTSPKRQKSNSDKPISSQQLSTNDKKSSTNNSKKRMEQNSNKDLKPRKKSRVQELEDCTWEFSVAKDQRKEQPQNSSTRVNTSISQPNDEPTVTKKRISSGKKKAGQQLSPDSSTAVSSRAPIESSSKKRRSSERINEISASSSNKRRSSERIKETPASSSNKRRSSDRKKESPASSVRRTPVKKVSLKNVTEREDQIYLGPANMLPDGWLVQITPAEVDSIYTTSKWYSPKERYSFTSIYKVKTFLKMLNLDGNEKNAYALMNKS